MKKLTAILLATLASCATQRAGEAQVYRLQHIGADQAARTICREEKAAKSSILEIAADARTNSVVVVGSKDDLVRIERRIRQLDVRQP